jgi:hypothetical protein
MIANDSPYFAAGTDSDASFWVQSKLAELDCATSKPTRSYATTHTTDLVSQAVTSINDHKNTAVIVNNIRHVVTEDETSRNCFLKSFDSPESFSNSDVVENDNLLSIQLDKEIESPGVANGGTESGNPKINSNVLGKEKLKLEGLFEQVERSLLKGRARIQCEIAIREVIEELIGKVRDDVTISALEDAIDRKDKSLATEIFAVKNMESIKDELREGVLATEARLGRLTKMSEIKDETKPDAQRMAPACATPMELAFKSYRHDYQIVELANRVEAALNGENHRINEIATLTSACYEDQAIDSTVTAPTVMFPEGTFESRVGFPDHSADDMLNPQDNCHFSMKKTLVQGGYMTFKGVLRLVFGLNRVSVEFSTSSEATVANEAMKSACYAGLELGQTVIQTMRAAKTPIEESIMVFEGSKGVRKYVDRLLITLHDTKHDTDLDERQSISRNVKRMLYGFSLATKTTATKLAAIITKNAEIKQAFGEIIEGSKVIVDSTAMVIAAAFDRMRRVQGQ